MYDRQLFYYDDWTRRNAYSKVKLNWAPSQDARIKRFRLLAFSMKLWNNKYSYDVIRGREHEHFC